MALFNQINTPAAGSPKQGSMDIKTNAIQSAPLDATNDGQFDTVTSNHTQANQPAVNDSDVKLTGLQKAQARIAEMRASGEFNVVRLDPVEKAKANPKSLRAAITAHCFTCCGGGADPGVRQSVRDCKVTACSLHVLRPWQNVLGKSADQMTEEELEDNSGKTEDLIDETEE
ncbi:MAG: hypothetical protein CTY38_01295 [Methylotenera sp.]|uniref:hypothetical protein n=1 Tax=Methylotenera sp. TaxID=2051956 RepID=UPI000D457DE0|nr:hypothetical protein [Methylotenera sp.]PPC84711.1 MAG: hypothetical protein CTY38_01295 [Methylotenera sp.]